MNPFLNLKKSYYGTRVNLPKQTYVNHENHGYEPNNENVVYYESNYNFAKRMESERQKKEEERQKLYLSPSGKEKRARNRLANVIEKRPFKKIHKSNENHVPNLYLSLHQPEEANNHPLENLYQTPLRQRPSGKKKEWMSPTGNLTRNIKRLVNARGPLGLQTPKISMDERERRRRREERRMKGVEFSIFENVENKKTPRKRLEPHTPVPQVQRTPRTPNERSEQQIFFNSLTKWLRRENENENHGSTRLNLRHETPNGENARNRRNARNAMRAENANNEETPTQLNTNNELNN